jgi:hypothetical protein
LSPWNADSNNALATWKRNIFKIIDSRINYHHGNEHLPPKPRLTSRHVKKDILAFHSNFVLVPAHKAANNIIIVWRIHYSNVLHKTPDSTNAYSKTTASEKDIVNKNVTHISSQKVRIDEKELKYDKQDQQGKMAFNERNPHTIQQQEPVKLPIMDWIPKLHKKPYKARFIANSISSTTSFFYLTFHFIDVLFDCHKNTCN